MRIKYYFILDTNLNNSELFVYKYVLQHIGLVNYQIINDLNIMNNYLNDDNILIMSWNSSVNIAYKINGKIIISPFNLNILNNIEKKYGLLIGDRPIPTTNLKVLTHENNENNIFNYIG